MKKGFIPVVLSCLLAVPVIASCGEEPTPTPTPVTYHVSITNKDALTAAWTKNAANRTMAIAVDDPNANVNTLINNGSITITSDHPEIVRVTGRVLSAVGVGSAKVTVKFGESSDSVDISVAAPEHGTEADDPLTAEEAVAKAKALDSGVTTEVFYYVTGIVKTATWDSGYGNGEIHLAAGEDELILYRFVMDESCTFDPAAIKTGMTVKAYGNLQNYQGSKWEMPQGVKVLSVTENTIPCTKLDVSATEGTVEVGEVLRIEASVEPATTTDTLSYESDAPSIASVDAKGRILGLAAGTANIKVKCGTQEKSVAITVNAAVAGIKTLEKIDYISTSGTLPASKPAEKQTVTVVQTVPGQEETIKVNFEGLWATSPSSYGNTLQSNATDDYIHGDPAANLYVHKITMDLRKYVNIEVYATDDLSGEKIAPVNISGRAGSDDHVVNEYVVNSKTWSIKANYNGTSHYHSMQLTVGAEPMVIDFTGVELPAESMNLVQGQTVNAAAALKDAGVEGVSVSYSSDHPEIASVDEGGVVKMLAGEGSAVITATGTKDDKTFSDTMTVTSLGGALSMGITPDAETDYYLGVRNTNLANTVYATGLMSGNYGATTESVESAAKVRFISVDGGYQMKLTYTKDGADVVKYLEAVVASNKYTNVVFKDSPTDGFKWEMDTTNKFFKVNLQDFTGDNVSKNGYYYLGIQNAYNTISLYAANNATKANNFVAWGYTLGELPAATAISVSASSVTVETDKTAKVTVTSTPADALPILTWESSDELVATVKDGVITGVAKGECKVTVTADGFVDAETTPDLQKEIAVKVKEPYVFVGEGTLEKPYTVDDAWHVIDDMEKDVVGADTFITKGYVTKIETAFTAANGYVTVWMDDAADGAQDKLQAYKLYGYGGSKLTSALDIEVGDFITVSGKYENYNGTKYEIASEVKLVDIVKATSHELESVALDKTTAKVAPNGTLDLRATIIPSIPYSKDAVWSSDHPEIATVENGVVTGVALGTANITVTVGAKSATCAVKVVTETLAAGYVFTNPDSSKSSATAYTDLAKIYGGFTKGASDPSLITGVTAATKLYYGANGGSGDSSYYEANVLKLGTSSAGGSITISLDSSISFNLIRIKGVGWKSGNGISVGGVTSSWSVYASKANMSAPETLDFAVSSGATSLTIEATGNSSVIFSIEFITVSE